MRTSPIDTSIFFKIRLIFHAVFVLVLILPGRVHANENPADVLRPPTDSDWLLPSERAIWTLGNLLMVAFDEPGSYHCELNSVMVNSRSSPIIDGVSDSRAPKLFSLFFVLLVHGTRQIISINNRMLLQSDSRYVFGDPTTGIQYEFHLNEERSTLVRIRKTNQQEDVLFDCQL